MTEQNKDVILGKLESIQYELTRDDFDIVATIALTLVATGQTKAEVNENLLQLTETKVLKVYMNDARDGRIVEIVEG